MDNDTIFYLILFIGTMLGLAYFNHMSEDEVKCQMWKRY